MLFGQKITEEASTPEIGRKWMPRSQTTKCWVESVGSKSSPGAGGVEFPKGGLTKPGVAVLTAGDQNTAPGTRPKYRTKLRGCWSERCGPCGWPLPCFGEGCCHGTRGVRVDVKRAAFQLSSLIDIWDLCRWPELVGQVDSDFHSSKPALVPVANVHRPS